jgi:hypothetical protein
MHDALHNTAPGDAQAVPTHPALLHHGCSVDMEPSHCRRHWVWWCFL